jgi:hypothetical protein
LQDVALEFAYEKMVFQQSGFVVADDEGFGGVFYPAFAGGAEVVFVGLVEFFVEKFLVFSLPSLVHEQALGRC